MKKKSIMLCCFLLMGIVSLLFFNYFFKPRLINLDEEIVINYKDDINFKYKAFYRDKDISDLVKINGYVDTEEVGVYYLEYSVLYNGVSDYFKQKIIVKDKVDPVFVLGEDNYYVCPDEKYKSNIKVFDNLDGDISDEVITAKIFDNYYYLVTDSSGNISFDNRKVIYEDRERPVIDLGPDSEIDIYINNEYVELGYVAYDNCDDVNDKVEIINNVDITKVGSYEIIYKVEDLSGNKSEVKRIVNVKEKPALGSIYLTFDDGPNTGTTDKILDILKNEGVSATFFVIGEGEDLLIKRMYDEGHTVALHTYSHVYSDIYSSVDNFYNDLNLISERIYNITGVRSKILRFAGGSSNTISDKYNKGIMSILVNDTISKGYKYYDWNIDSGDARYGSSKDEVYSNVVDNLSKDKYNMVLMHDTKKKTVDVLPLIIKYAKENGYVFEKIDDNTEMINQRVNN